MRRRAPSANMSDPIEDEAMAVVKLSMGMVVEEATEWAHDSGTRRYQYAWRPVAVLMSYSEVHLQCSLSVCGVAPSTRSREESLATGDVLRTKWLIAFGSEANRVSSKATMGQHSRIVQKVRRMYDYSYPPQFKGRRM